MTFWRFCTGALATNHGCSSEVPCSAAASFHSCGLLALRWMAAARYVTMELYFSEDDGNTWGEPQIVTAKNEINGHLLRLKDGRILLAYGNRVKTGNQLGVLAKLSSDEGKTWGEPIRIGHTSTWDCGYPSTVQRADGKLVTAWYAGASDYHNRYHMAVAIWDADHPPANP